MVVPGSKVGSYTLLAELGAGGFGSVWLAQRDGGPGEVALKVLHPTYAVMPPPSNGPSVADRFIAEARLIAKLSHPGLVRIFEVIDEREHALIAYAMERLIGRDLSQMVKTLGAADLLEVFARAAETLAHLHAQDVIHRDVKPANIFICEPAPGSRAAHTVKLLDFGIAKDLSDDRQLASTATGHFLGTLQAMAPECFYADASGTRRLTGAIDQWALGVGLYWALSGQLPFHHENVPMLIHKIETERPAAIRPREVLGLSTMPAGLDAIVRRALEKEPRARYPDMTAMAQALRVARAQLGSRSGRSIFEGVPEDGETLLGIDGRLSEARAMARQMRRETERVRDRDQTVAAPSSASRAVQDEIGATLVRPSVRASSDAPPPGAPSPDEETLLALKKAAPADDMETFVPGSGPNSLPPRAGALAVEATVRRSVDFPPRSIDLPARPEVDDGVADTLARPSKELELEIARSKEILAEQRKPAPRGRSPVTIAAWGLLAASVALAAASVWMWFR